MIIIIIIPNPGQKKQEKRNLSCMNFAVSKDHRIKLWKRKSPTNTWTFQIAEKYLDWQVTRRLNIVGSLETVKKKLKKRLEEIAIREKI